MAAGLLAGVNGRYFRSNGSGPSRLMSPLNTFISCGSSSRLVERMRRPIGVRRSLSGKSFPAPLCASVMVLNLIRWNILFFLPRRGWMKKNVLCATQRTIVKKRLRGDKISNNEKESKISINLLNRFLYIIMSIWQ